MPLRFQTFGQWFVLGKAVGKGKEHFWVCQCSCNAMAEIHGAALTEGRARGCGCQLQPSRKDITGQLFGAWLVLTLSRRRSRSRGLWVCQCRCSTLREMSGDRLRSGATTDCGCLRTKVVPHRWYGRLFTLKRAGTAADRSALWSCQCACGAMCAVRSRELITGRTRSCGCLKRQGHDLQGQVFGRLTALERTGTASGGILWSCQCTCGATCTVKSDSLATGHTRSCGCLQHGRRGGKEKLDSYCKPCARRLEADQARRRKARLEAQPVLLGSLVTAAAG